MSPQGVLLLTARPNDDTSTVDYTSTVVPIPTTTTEPHVATPIPTRICES